MNNINRVDVNDNMLSNNEDVIVNKYNISKKTTEEKICLGEELRKNIYLWVIPIVYLIGSLITQFISDGSDISSYLRIVYFGVFTYVVINYRLRFSVVFFVPYFIYQIIYYRYYYTYEAENFSNGLDTSFLFLNLFLYPIILGLVIWGILLLIKYLLSNLKNRYILIIISILITTIAVSIYRTIFLSMGIIQAFEYSTGLPCTISHIITELCNYGIYTDYLYYFLGISITNILLYRK